jgi:hypothetical protein
VISNIINLALETGHLVSVCLRPEDSGWTLMVGFDAVPAACEFGRKQAWLRNQSIKTYKAADDYMVVNCPVTVRSERPHPLVTQRWDLRAMSTDDARWALGLYAQL